jgi:hypothetical protein
MNNNNNNNLLNKIIDVCEDEMCVCSHYVLYANNEEKK